MNGILTSDQGLILVQLTTQTETPLMADPAHWPVIEGAAREGGAAAGHCVATHCPEEGP